jgi:hypothetical protein
MWEVYRRIYLQDVGNLFSGGSNPKEEAQGIAKERKLE